MQVNNTYVGRFAPSPTGPLHFGSLIAALASYLDAKHHKGAWLLRIEDLDPPRESPTAPSEIIGQLQQLGFKWDADISFQSQNLDHYANALKSLSEKSLLYACACSRKSFDSVYPGRCRDQRVTQTPHALRIRTTDSLIRFRDLFQGDQQFDLGHDIGDFILKRKDGLFAYQIAVVVDDQRQGVTHVVRGSDLLDSTPKQIYVNDCLGFSQPIFGHIPVIVDKSGSKLSKQTHAAPISMNNKADTLKKALGCLGQPIPNSHETNQILEQAIAQWSRSAVPQVGQIESPLTR